MVGRAGGRAGRQTCATTQCLAACFMVSVGCSDGDVGADAGAVRDSGSHDAAVSDGGPLRDGGPPPPYSCLWDLTCLGWATCMDDSGCEEGDACTRGAWEDNTPPGFCGSQGCVAPDGDGDGYASPLCGGGDCNDDDPSFFPDAPDIVGNCADESCDCIDGTDADGDGHPSIASGGDDCDDADPNIRPDSPADRWSHEALDAVMSPTHIDMAIDDSGSMHVSYLDDVDHTARHVTNESGAWSSTVVRDETWGSAPRMVVEADGTVHIVTGGTGLAAGMEHAVSEPSLGAARTWTVTSLSTGLADGQVTAIALFLEASGRIDVAYRLIDTGALWYATLDVDGTWTRQGRIEEDGDGPSIAVDGSGLVAVSRFDWGTRNFWFESLVDGAWIGETVDEGLDVGMWSVLRVDPTGALRLGYAPPGWLTFRIGTRDGGVWSFEDVDGFSSVSDFVFDPTGSIHAVHFGGYATNASGAWTTETVDLDGTFSGSIALDADGEAHIAYATQGLPRLVGDFYGSEIRVTAPPVPDEIDQDCDGIRF